MAMKQPSRKTYRTAQGKQIDMDLLRKKNELVPAVGNARVNARGDELGPGGKIIRKREDIVNEYYKNTNVVPDDSGKQRTEEVTPPKKKASVKKGPAKNKAKDQKPTAKELSEWEEDENGDFVRKGE